MLPTCSIGYCNVPHRTDPPRHVPSFPTIYCRVLTLPVLLFHINSHSNPLCPVRPILSWTVSYRFVTNYLSPSYSLPSRWYPLCSLPYWSDSSLAIKFHSTISSWYPLSYFLSQSDSSPPIVLHRVLSYCNTLHYFLSRSDSSHPSTLHSVTSYCDLLRTFTFLSDLPPGFSLTGFQFCSVSYQSPE